MEEQKLLKRKQKAAGNNTVLVSACTDLASHYISIGRYSKAIKEYETLAKIYKDEKKMILYAQTQRGLGESYMGLQDFERAIKHFKIYYEVAFQEHNVLEQQRSLAQLGHLYLTWYLETLNENNKNLLDEAYGYFVKSMRKCESLSDTIEKQDMLARLFSNLGLVKENLADYETSLNLYEKSIKICLKHDFYEQLFRGYLSMGSLFEKQEIFQETIKNYNLAIEIAKKLSTKRVELICAALLAKAQTLIKIADFQGSKQVLRKAYKFKTPNKEEKELIERYLRVVACMCKIEDDIITCNDQKQLKNLYEKMGDGACDLKNFPKAIEYYKKMLEAAEQTGASDKEVGECLYSLAETYKDNGDYQEAEIYFEKEYNLCKNNLKDSLNTICKIADLKEMANRDVEEIKAVYERGLANCKKKQNLKEEKGLLIRYMDFLKRSLRHKQAFQMEQELNKLNEKLGDDDDATSSSEYESEDSTKIHIGDDIVLSDITDVSEESDNEVPGPSEVQPAKRRKQNTVKFKKNLNGEWPLHVACIQGNQKMVQYWLDVGHPINVRDHAGWLPLHEAAVHGHLDIVRMLLDQKASINDRGGSECNGITPLHDAASNGHLEVIELLLDKGASAVAKTDDGNTPLFELRKWYDRTEDSLNNERLCLYNTLVKRLESALDKAGQKDTEKEVTAVIDSPDKEKVCSVTTKLGKLRRYTHLEETPDEDFDEEISKNHDNLSQTSLHSEKNASNEYQMVMQTLRHKNYSTQKHSSPVKQTTSKRSALVDEHEFVNADEWLENDIRPGKSKKRRTNSSELLWGRSASFGTANTSPNIRVEDRFSQPNLLFDEDEDTTAEFGRRDSTSSTENNRSSFPRRRTQATLLDSGFSRQRSTNSPDFRSSNRAHSQQTVRSSQIKIMNYGTQAHAVVEADSTTVLRNPYMSFDPTQSVADPMLYVDVEIEGRVFRVPVLLSQIQIKTIKWLAEEAAHRYESKEYMKPVLELETINGAILGASDLLCLLFPMGCMQAEKVVGKVREWSLPSVMERYKDTCVHMGVDVDDDLCNIIQTLSVNLDISDQGILGKDLNPLLKAINNQKSLTEINLSGNFLSIHAMGALCSAIVTLPNLQVLNLSCTGLHRAYLCQLASMVASNEISLNQLVDLDLSDNILLKTDCLKDLAVITSKLNLRKLNLSNIALGSLGSFQGVLHLKGLEHLNISYNRLQDEDIRRVMLWLDGTMVKSLDLSRNAGRKVLRQFLEVFQYDSGIVLEDMNLEECGVNDSNLFELLRLAQNIQFLTLSYNPDLTSISLRRLLECGRLSYVNLMCCERIWTYFDPTGKGWSVNMQDRDGKAEFKISEGSRSFYDCIVAIFKDKYERSLQVKFSGGSLNIMLNFK